MQNQDIMHSDAALQLTVGKKKQQLKIEHYDANSNSYDDLRLCKDPEFNLQLLQLE